MKNRKLYIVFFFGLILPGLHSKLFSQAVKTAVDRDRIFIGEQIKLKLSVERAKAGMAWFTFPDSVNHIEVVKKSKIDTVLNGSFANYYQTVSITSFDSGRWNFPSLSLPGVTQSTPPISITVMPVDVSKMQDYNDIKDIEEARQGNNPLITFIIAAITLLSIAMIYWLLSKKKKVILPGLNLNGNLSPLAWAIAELNKLNAHEYNTPDAIKRYYSDLTNISRTFFSRQLQQRSLYQTTDEWMVSLQALAVDTETKISFFQFLRQADAVKFAKYLPPAKENETSVAVIKQMLQKVSLLDSNVYSNYQPK